VPDPAPQPFDDAERIDVSIVVPVYNSARTLHQLLERLRSAFAAGERDVEVVFVEDGSRDDSGAVL
jgi:glycosyltransferase involved in cell wall biosynthesis